ncbi:MAG TPA: hypothetical protein VFL55_01760 [Acetobacteraceae bacterium]|nr:hypothetical protein [Acetobacteraceae bacterium]
MEQTTIVWFSMGTAVIGGLIILVAGFLLGLGCGLRSHKAADPSMRRKNENWSGAPDPVDRASPAGESHQWHGQPVSDLATRQLATSSESHPER